MAQVAAGQQFPFTYEGIDKKGKKVKHAARAEARSKKEVVVKTKDIKKIAQVQLNKK